MTHQNIGGSLFFSWQGQSIARRQINVVVGTNAEAVYHCGIAQIKLYLPAGSGFHEPLIFWD